jgi:hypothetical protein
MDGVTLGNPYLPKDWTTALDLTESQTLSYATPGVHQLLGADSERLYFLIAAENPSSAWFLWPSQQTQQWGIAPQTGVNFLLIHHASYPGLVQGPWYIFTIAAGDRWHLIPGRMIREGEKRDVY